MKPIVQCPQCGQSYQAAPEWAGKTTNCPACGTLIQIPHAAQLAPVAYAPPVQPAPKPQPAYLQQQPPAHVQLQAGNSTNPLVWAAIGGGVIAVFFVFTLLIYALGRSNGRSAATAQAPAPEHAPTSSPSSANSSSSNTITPQPIDTLPPRPSRPVVMPPAPVYTPTPTPSPSPPPPSPTATETKPAPADWTNTETKPATAPQPPATQAPAAPAVEFGSQIVINDRGGVVFGPAGCPVVLTGSQVWEVEARKLRSELTGRTEPRGLAVISPDGNTIAAAGKSPNQQDTEVVVWDTNTGEQKFTVPGDDDRFVDTMYLSDTKLFLGGRDNNSLHVWDLATGFQGKSIEIENARLGRGKVGFTLDGNYVAVPVKDKLTVFRTSNGKMAAVMGAPKGDATFVYAWLQSLQFSADSLELAGVSTDPKPHVMCWDNRGKLVFDQPFYVDSRAFWENTMQWFPNKQAWMIETDIFDRTSGKIVLTIRKKFAQDLYIHVHDDDHLVGTFPNKPTQLEVLEIPWEKIRASQTAMKKKEPAILSPALPVSLLIQLGDLRGDQAEVKTLIETAFTERLQRDGFTVAPGGKSYFRIKFAEAAGDTLPIFERQRFQWGPGRDTGRTATESKGDLVVELFVFGRTDPIWRDTMKVTSSSSFNEEITDATIRKSMLDRAAMEIRRLNFPYFIPESEEMVALPIVVQ